MLGCKSSKQSMEQSAADLSYYTVSFISIGTGIDYEARIDCMEFIKEFEDQFEVILSYQTINWGREGEVNYCFDLSNLNQEHSNIFKEELEGLLQKSSLVQFNTSEICKK